MNVPVQPFDPNRVAVLGRLFSDEIDTDDWVMFHGTSGFNAESIEREGFSSQHGIVSHKQIGRIVQIYEAMKWAGESAGGYAVLKHFSFDYDWVDHERSLLFFSETSLRALLYATRDFCGGEKLRALRTAFGDLDLYLSQSDTRERHRTWMDENFSALKNLNAHPSMLDAARPVKVDLDWLRQKMADIGDIRQLVDDRHQRHDHGVVYALRMTATGLDGLRWNSSMGIEAINPIPASRIVGKISVPPDYKWNSLAGTPEEYLRRLNRGLLAALAAQPRGPRGGARLPDLPGRTTADN